MDSDVELARGVLTETLHGPVPMATVARLAEAVLRLAEARQERDAERLRYGQQRAANAVWMGLAAHLARNGQQELALSYKARAEAAAANVRLEDFTRLSLPLPPTPPDAKGSREVESWHLPREQAAQDGKHVVVIEEPTAPPPPGSSPRSTKPR